MELEVHCINSGQGNSIALQLPDDSFMVVDIDCHGDTPVDPVDYLKELVPEEYDTENDNLPDARKARRMGVFSGR